MSRMHEAVGSGETSVGSAGADWCRRRTADTEPADDAPDKTRTGAQRLWAAPDDLADAVLAAQRGNEESFRVIYRAVQPGLLRYLRILVGEDAEDVASEAWLHIARDLSSFRGNSDGFRGWAATIARHRALDHLRHRRRRPGLTSVSTEQLTDRPSDDDTAGAALDALSTDTALALIARLPHDQAEAVLLRVVMGLDAKTAGRVLGKRSGAVRTAAYRGLRKLAEFFEHSDTADLVRLGKAATSADGHGDTAEST